MNFQIMNQEVQKNQTPPKQFEAFLTVEQHTLLQKILPVGYSLATSDKTPRNPKKRGMNITK
jgi:hypothetical protein